MGVFDNFTGLFLSVWEKGILGVNFVEILIGLGIFFIFLVFRGLISKLVIRKLEIISKELPINLMILLLRQWRDQQDFCQLF